MTTTGAQPWVADLYDAYVTFSGDLAFWREEALGSRGPVLELMCGTGRVSLPLIRAGVRLTCVDLSPWMLRRLAGRLAQEGLSADLHAADVSRLDLPERGYGLAILAFGSFSEILTADAQAATLERVRAHLAPDGRFVCALNNPSRRRVSIDGTRRLVGVFPLSGSGMTLHLWSTQSIEPGSTTVRALQTYDLYDAGGRQVEQRQLDVRYDLLEPSAFERLAVAAGFRVRAVWGDYDRSRFDPATSPYAVIALDR